MVGGQPVQQPAGMPGHALLLDLPLEVLLNIFEQVEFLLSEQQRLAVFPPPARSNFCVTGSRAQRRFLQLPLVCKRFRNILSAPSPLWQSIKLGPLKVDVAPLHRWLVPRSPSIHTAAFMELRCAGLVPLLLPLGPHLRDLTVHVSATEHWAHEALLESDAFEADMLSGTLHDCMLCPKLVRLEVQHVLSNSPQVSTPEIYAYAGRFPINRPLSLFCLSHMPALSTLVLPSARFYPSELVQFASTSLRSLAFVWDPQWGSTDPLTALTHLTFLHVCGPPVDDDTSARSPLAFLSRLVGLRSLSVCGLSVGGALDLSGLVSLTCLCMRHRGELQEVRNPNCVSQLQVLFLGSSDGQPELSLFRWCAQHLTELNLELSDWNIVLGSAGILRTLPKLQHMSLKVQHRAPPLLPLSSVFTDIQHLTALSIQGVTYPFATHPRMSYMSLTGLSALTGLQALRLISMGIAGSEAQLRQCLSGVEKLDIDKACEFEGG